MSFAENHQRLADALRLDVIDLADDLPDARTALNVLAELGADRLRASCPETAKFLDEDRRLVEMVAVLLAANVEEWRRPDSPFDFDSAFLRAAVLDPNPTVRGAAQRELETDS